MQEAEQEAFESIQTGSHLKKRAKKKGRKQDLDVDEDDFFKSLSATKKLPKFVELLKFKMLAPGMTLWGMITEIRTTDLLVNLPHGLQGRVILENASDHLAKKEPAGGKDTRHLSQYFVQGSYVRCSVVSVSGHDGQDTKKKRIDLATKVSIVNKGLRRDAVCAGACLSGCVKSVEDHGYIIDFGVANTRGFLKKEWAPKDYLQGSIVDVVVKTMKHDGNAIVTAVPEEVDSSVTLEWSGVDINSLTPGSLVNVKVQNILSDGLLVSFLTFFTGTIDPFHLDKGVKEFHEGDKIKARILYCDHQTKSIGLSLLPHLLRKRIPILPSRGDIFESAIVKRIDLGLGIMLTLPAPKGSKEDFQAYAHISNLSDKDINDIRSHFRPGQVVKCRVIGSRPMDGIASVSLKPSVVEGSLFDMTEIKPGMKITGIVNKVDDNAIVLQISPHLRAIVPALHYSDTVHKKSHKKFKEGQTVSGRVLEVKPDRKIIVTMKKSLIESKYPMIAGFDDVVSGMRSHGVVTGVKDKGIFVTFFNNIAGMINVDHLGIKASQKVEDVFTVGQIVKVRVLGANVKSHRLRLTLLSKQQLAELASKNDTLGQFNVGELVQGTIDSVVKNEKADGEVTGYVLKLEQSGTESKSLARLDVSHLADHPTACSSLQESIGVGTVLKDLVVLEKLDQVQRLKLTNKDSIRQAVLSGNMPKTLEDLRVGTVFPGFVASVTSNAVFVRFLDHLTARASLNQVTDATTTDLSSMFHVNMSVRACVSHIDLEKQQATISLKQNMCSDRSGSYISTLFKDLEFAYSLEDDSPIDWESAFPYGDQVNVTVHSIKEYGILCDFEEYPDVVGLVAMDQVASLKEMTEGSSLSATILDISKKDGIVDLSALDGVRNAISDSKATNKAKKGDSVEVKILQIKPEEGYCIVSLPAGYCPIVGYMCVKDFNGRLIKTCQRDQTIGAKVVSIPSKDTGNRLVLVPDNAGKSALKALPDRGTEVEIKIDAVHTLYADISIEGTTTKGRLHISQIQQENKDGENPLRGLELGSKHKAFVIGASGRKGGKVPILNVSLISSNPIEWKTLKKDQQAIGYIQEINGATMWIAYSPFVKGRGFIPDMCESLEECRDIASRYKIGSSVSTKVLSVDPEKHSLDVAIDGENTEKSFNPGTLVLGCITKKSGNGIDVQIAWNTAGHVNLTDIYSVAVENALDAVPVGSFVQASVVSKRGAKRYNLSLRKSSGALSEIDENSIKVLKDVQIPKPSLKLSELSTGSKVSGYVKAAGKMGVFISIGRDVEARIKLRQLNDEFVEDPLQKYPPGTFVQGKVMAINDGKVDVTLRSRKATMNVDGFTEGQIIEGKVKRIEKYGVFVSINDSPVSGLAHMSELCDGYVQNVDSLFKVGQPVRARVIKVDKEGGKLSLGLKPSYFEIGDESDDDMDIQHPGDDDDDLDQQLLNGAANSDSASESDGEEDDDSDEEMDDIDQALMEQ